MKKLLKRNRQRVNEDLKDISSRKYFSPAFYVIVRELITMFDEFVKGDLLDVGCGDMPYRNYIKDKITKYDSLDVEKRTDEVTFMGSATDMHMIKDNTYDTAVSLFVFEHISDPFKAAGEVSRVLKKGGIFILGVPHLSRLHEEPHDYFRYTHHGLRSMLEDKGFEIVQMKKNGSFLSLMGHQLSIIVLCSVWHIPIIRQIFFFLNFIFIVCPITFIDRVFMKDTLMPLHYICVARKK